MKTYFIHVASFLFFFHFAFLASCQSISKVSFMEKQPLPYPESDFIFQDRSQPLEKKTNKEIPLDLSKEIISITKDNKGKILKTIFSGAVLVREVLKRNGLDYVKITISGNARIQHGKIIIQASRMVIEDNRIGYLRGKIEITDRESGVKIFSKEAVYNRDKQLIYLKDNPYMLIFTKKSNIKDKRLPALVSCTKMMRDLKANESRLKGDVRIHQDSWTLIGDEGIYKDGSDQILLKHSPFIFGINQFMAGKNLVYTISKKQASLDGKIIHLSRGKNILQDDSSELKPLSLEEFGRRGGLLPKSKKNSKDKKMLLSILTAQRISFSQDVGDKESQTMVTGDVLLTRKNLKVKANKLHALGRDFHTLYTQTGVDLYDYENNMHVHSGILDYKIKNRFLRLENRPSIEFYKKGTQNVESTLTAATIERDFEKNEMIARGDVHIIRKGFEAVGETARYYEEEGFILLEGNPGIVNEKNIIRSEKILYYIEKKKIFLYNKIRGYLGLGGLINGN